MFKLFSLLSVVITLLPTAAFANPIRFVNPANNRAEVVMTGFTAGQEVAVELQSLTKTVRGTCRLGANGPVYAQLSSDLVGEIETPFQEFIAAAGTPEIRVGSGPNIWGNQEFIDQGRCAFVDGTRYLVGPSTADVNSPSAVWDTARFGGLAPDLIIMRRLSPEGNVVGRQTLWVKVPDFEPVGVQLIGGRSERNFRANNCGIIRFAQTETAQLPTSFKIGSTIYQTGNLPTAYPPRCYKTGETTFTLFTPAN